MSVLVVTGTDTAVGKTAVTAALAAIALGAGRTVAVVKPAQTGVAADDPGDLQEIARLTGVTDLHELARYPDPLAPEAAARAVGSDGLGAEEIAAAVAGVAAGGADLVLVEGAGGLLVRLGAAGATLADVAGLVDAPVLVVTRAGLGALNHAALTCEALRTRGLRCVGLVIGSWPAWPGLAERGNRRDFPVYTGVPLLGQVPAGAPRLPRAAFAAKAPDWISTEGVL
jgi:dethiobiotin synthase